MELTIALAQMAIRPSDPVKNVARMEELVAEAKGQGAELVIFPEDAVCGPLAGQTTFVESADAYLRHMQALAVRHTIDLVPGTWTVAENGVCYNQAHYINADGSVAGIYRKINLWETEKATIAPGASVSVFDTRFGRVGMVICWDLAFPALFSAMVEQGAQLVIAPAYWSFTRPEPEVDDVLENDILLIDSLCTARAFENNVLLAYCNAAGKLALPEGVSVLSGRSQVTHPLDKVLMKSKRNREELLVGKVELLPI